MHVSLNIGLIMWQPIIDNLRVE